MYNKKKKTPPPICKFHLIKNLLKTEKKNHIINKDQTHQQRRNVTKRGGGAEGMKQVDTDDVYSKFKGNFFLSVQNTDSQLDNKKKMLFAR